MGSLRAIAALLVLALLVTGCAAAGTPRATRGLTPIGGDGELVLLALAVVAFAVAAVVDVISLPISIPLDEPFYFTRGLWRFANEDH